MVDEKINNLINQMRIDEKISLLAGADLWHTVPINRLNIPSIKVTDGPIGARGSQGSSSPPSACFPAPVAMGATWNVELIKQVGKALAQETKSKNAQILLAPMVNIMRSPLAGRNFECFSEDPYLTARFAVAYIQGLQEMGIGACIKHFVCNDSDFERTTISSEVDERTLREIYLLPFEIAVQEAEPWSVMSAYNKLNGVSCSENRRLLIEILKGEWGFDGLVMSDWYGTYSSKAAEGGLDLEMPGPARWMGADIQNTVKKGSVSEEELDDKVIRILKAIQSSGNFEERVHHEEYFLDDPAINELTRRVAEESIVLLKNENVLPLDLDNVDSIAVIGENAKWAQPIGGGSSAVHPPYVVSPLQAIKSFTGDRANIRYEVGSIVHKSTPLLDMDLIASNTGEHGCYSVEVFDNLDLTDRPAKLFSFDRANLTWSDEMLSNVDPKAFSARLSASFTPARSGKHLFSLTGNGLFRLLLDGKTVVDTWSGNLHVDEPPWGAPEQIGEIELLAGHSYKLLLEYSWKGNTPWRIVRIGHWEVMGEDLLSAAVDLAAECDVALIFAGLTNEWESEGYDRTTMDLPGEQDELIRQVSEANPNTIVILNSGAPVSMPWLEKIPAILQSWYGGQELGNAVAGVLFGDVNPSGKLPVTFPQSLQHNPAYINYPGEFGSVRYGEGIFVGYRYYEKKNVNPNFVFGYGLSYTEYYYSNLEVNTDSYTSNGIIRVSCDIENEGSLAGYEVVQLYVRDIESTAARPVKELKAFEKVFLQPGENQTINFNLDRRSLAFYDPNQTEWIVEGGEFEVLIGSSSQDIRLTGGFYLQ